MSIISEEEKQRRRSYWNMAIGLQSANGEIEMKDIVPMIKNHYDSLKNNK